MFVSSKYLVQLVALLSSISRMAASPAPAQASASGPLILAFKPEVCEDGETADLRCYTMPDNTP